MAQTRASGHEPARGSTSGSGRALARVWIVRQPLATLRAPAACRPPAEHSRGRLRTPVQRLKARRFPIILQRLRASPAGVGEPDAGNKDRKCYCRCIKEHLVALCSRVVGAAFAARLLFHTAVHTS
jgi:hypothetical protein